MENNTDKNMYVHTGMTPKQIVNAYSSGEWENFIEEWTYSLKPKYYEIVPYHGPGDMGRDIACYYGPKNSGCKWDNYQCKHYNKPLPPSEIWIELGKLCYYTFMEEYSVPKEYYFIASNDIGTKLSKLLSNQDALKAELIRNWDTHCKKDITETKEILLNGEFKRYVEAFDLSIVSSLPLLKIIKDHMETKFWITRFKQEIPARTASIIPPLEPDKIEMPYLQQLLDAYGDAEDKSFSDLNDASLSEKYIKHITRSRNEFYKAESLNRFSRDLFPENPFDDLKKQIYDGIIETVEADHENGYKRVCETTSKAASLHLGNTPIASKIEVGDQKGICHHLANDDKVKWVKK